MNVLLEIAWLYLACGVCGLLSAFCIWRVRMSLKEVVLYLITWPRFLSIGVKILWQSFRKPAPRGVVTPEAKKQLGRTFNLHAQRK